MTRTGQVGIFGGTFNPIHLGHLRAAEEVVEALGLERMIFVPCALPPHKGGSAGDPLASAEERLTWVRTAIRDNPRFEASALEVERGGRSYTVETLRELGREMAPEHPTFVLGQDAFVEMDSWREPREIFRLAHVAVMTRPPVAVGSLAHAMPKRARDDVEITPDGLFGRHTSAGTWVRLLAIRALDISASDIRARLREGRSVRYLLPESLSETVAKSGAYA